MRWALWTGVVALLLLILLFPLRLAIEAADLQRLGLSARQVSGTIWDGRISGLTLNRQELGTFDVRLHPGPLLLGRGAMRFERNDELYGSLDGTLISGGGRNGVEAMTGRLGTATLFAPLPVEALEFRQATILFRDGSCSEARGQITAVVGTRFGGLDLTRGLSGPVSCEGRRVRARLASEGGRESLEFFLAEDGQYRAFMTLRGLAPEVAAGLQMLGFSGGPSGVTLSTSGRL